MYEPKSSLGFGGIPGENSPWASWAKVVNSEVPQAFFEILAKEQSALGYNNLIPALDRNQQNLVRLPLGVL